MNDDKRYTQSTKTIKVSRTTAGAGRWTYCKYCYKNVQPFIHIEEWMDGWQHLLCCSECGSGLAIVDRAGTMPLGERHGGLADD